LFSRDPIIRGNFYRTYNTTTNIELIPVDPILKLDSPQVFARIYEQRWGAPLSGSQGK
jgi:hypothetical protein